MLERSDGRARLRHAAAAGGQAPTETVRVSPRMRVEPLADTALPTLQTHLIEPFLAEPVIVDEATLLQAPRIVAAPDNRVLITRGDRAYARGRDRAADAAGGRPQPTTTACSAMPSR